MNEAITVEDNKGQVVPLNMRAREVMQPAMEELVLALPATISPEKFQSAFVTAVVNNPEILKCNPSSIRTALMKAATDGLMPDGRKAAIVPFKGKAQYMPMAAGLIDRAAELGEAFSFTAECVYEHDHFEVNLADPNDTEHRFGNEVFGDRGEIIGAYAVFRSRDGVAIHRELMSKKEIDKVRNVSRMKDAGPWKNWYSEMARKSVVRRGSKYIPVSSALRTIIERDDAQVDFRQGNTTPEGYNPLQEAPETLEGTVNELEQAIDNAEVEDVPPATEKDKLDLVNMIATIQKAKSVDDIHDWQASRAEDIAALHPEVKADLMAAIKAQTAELRKAGAK